MLTAISFIIAGLLFVAMLPVAVLMFVLIELMLTGGIR